MPFVKIISTVILAAVKFFFFFFLFLFSCSFDPWAFISVSLLYFGGQCSISVRRGMDGFIGNMGGEFSTSKLGFMNKNFQGNAMFKQVCLLVGRSWMQLVHLLAGGLHSYKQCKYHKEGLSNLVASDGVQSDRYILKVFTEIRR